MPPRTRVLIDNDFSGDPDDLFQLAHHVLSPSVTICGVIGSHLAPGDLFDPSTHTAANAATAAQELLHLMGRNDIPVYCGADHALPDRQTPIPSEAMHAIIREARQPTDTPLVLACGAGLTDLASALMVAPEIAQRLTLIWIGGPEYPELASPPPGAVGGEYNLTIDLPAAQYLFNDTTVPIWQVPRNVYRQCVVSMAELEERVRPQGRLGHTLYHALDRVFQLAHDRIGLEAETYVLGDQPLVLLTALLTLFEPDAASSAAVWRARPTITDAGTYAEQGGRGHIRVFTRIDTRLLFADLYAKLARAARQPGA